MKTLGLRTKLLFGYLAMWGLMAVLFALYVPLNKRMRPNEPSLVMLLRLPES